MDPLTQMINAQVAARQGIAGDAPVEILSNHLDALRTAEAALWPLVDPLNFAGVNLGPLMEACQRLCWGLRLIDEVAIP